MKASRELTAEVPATEDQGCTVRPQNNAGQSSFCSRIAFLPVAIFTVLLRAPLSKLPSPQGAQSSSTLHRAPPFSRTSDILFVEREREKESQLSLSGSVVHCLPKDYLLCQ